jgi:hypothetical protein
MAILLIICLLAMQISSFAATKEWSSEEKLSKVTKPAVVRVWAFYWGTWNVGGIRINSFYGGFGSGAFVHPDGYIVTNAHVVETYNHTEKQRWQNLALDFVKTLITRYGLTKEQAIALVTTGTARLESINTVFMVVTPGGEELPFDLKEIGSPAGEKDGKDVAIIKVEGRNFPTLRLGDSDKIRTGERIFVAGYPGDADLGSWGNRKSQLEWSWAPGSISSDRKATAQGSPLIQVNAEGVKPGNSGGPVLNSDGQIIGLLTFGTAGGPHWAMATRTVQEYIRKAGISNETSLTDTAYKDGLNFYWQGYYSKAVVKFEEVRRLYPKHSEADALVAECQNNITQGNDNRYWPDYYPYLGGALVLLTVLAVVLVVIIRRRKIPPKQTEVQ